MLDSPCLYARRMRSAVCTSIETCPVRHLPNGVSVPPKECTSDTLRPHSGEATKRFGCFCGGLSSDTFSSWICNKAQPWTHWMIELRAGIGENSSLADGTPFGAHIYERAGTPANVRGPSPTHPPLRPLLRPLTCAMRAHTSCMHAVLCLARPSIACTCSLHACDVGRCAHTTHGEKCSVWKQSSTLCDRRCMSLCAAGCLGAPWLETSSSLFIEHSASTLATV